MPSGQIRIKPYKALLSTSHRRADAVSSSETHSLLESLLINKTQVSSFNAFIVNLFVILIITFQKNKVKVKLHTKLLSYRHVSHGCCPRGSSSSPQSRLLECSLLLPGPGLSEGCCAGFKVFIIK